MIPDRSYYVRSRVLHILHLYFYDQLRVYDFNLHSVIWNDGSRVWCHEAAGTELGVLTTFEANYSADLTKTSIWGASHHSDILHGPHLNFWQSRSTVTYIALTFIHHTMFNVVSFLTFTNGWHHTPPQNLHHCRWPVAHWWYSVNLSGPVDQRCSGFVTCMI